MANFTVSPLGLVFTKARVRGQVDGLYPTPETKSFVFTNNTGGSVTILDAGFSRSTEGDDVTEPTGHYRDADFAIVVHSGSFPVTVANSASKQFDVTYAPKRRGSGFGDVRSAIVSLINDKNLNIKVGVGGGVIESGFDWPSTHPAMGLPADFNLADMDSCRHYNPVVLLFEATAAATGSYDVTSLVTGNQKLKNAGARSVQVLVWFQDISQGCDLKIYAETTGGDVLVAEFDNLNYANVSGLFVGGNEGIDLQGLRLKAQILNLKNSQKISVGYYKLA